MAEEAEQVEQAEQAEQEVNRAALGFLERVGVWPDAALRIATKLVENQRRGHDYLPSLADVLGWIAYCFGDGKKNNVDQPAALLAANLLAGRRCRRNTARSRCARLAASWKGSASARTSQTTASRRDSWTLPSNTRTSFPPPPSTHSTTALAPPPSGEYAAPAMVFPASVRRTEWVRL